MTWDVDFTTEVRADLVGLESVVSEALTDALVGWLDHGPPCQGERTLAGMTFYEEVIADRYVLGYAVDAGRQRFVLLWLRAKPGS